MKKKDYILIGVAVLFIVASFFLTGNKKEEPRDYNSILSNVEIKNAVNSISYDYFDALTQTSKENKIIYLGSASCSWCSKFKPILEDITNEYNLAVYYIDLATVSQSEYNKITEAVGDNFSGTPTTLIMKGSTVVDALGGYTEKENVVNFFKKNGFIG